MHPARPAPAAAARRTALAAFAALLTAASPPAVAAGAADAATTTLHEQVRSTLAPLVALPPAVRTQARVQIEVGTLDPRLRLAPCRRIEPRLPAHSPAWGRTRVALRCVDGERAWQVYLPVTVRVLAPAVSPAQPLPAGTVLGAAQLTLAEADWAASAQPLHARVEDLVGRTLSRAVAPGEPLRGEDLRQRQWFAAGDTVQVVARGAGFAVSGEAQALGPGLEGQTVRVRTESGRVLAAMPVGERRVEVLL